MKEEKKAKQEKQEIDFECAMGLEKAVEYVEKVLGGMKKGCLCVQQGDQQLTLKPSAMVQFEFEAKQKHDKQALSFEFTWMDGMKKVQDVGFTISSHEEGGEAAGASSTTEGIAERDPILFRSFVL